MFQPWSVVSAWLSAIVHRLARLSQTSGRLRWLLLALIIVAIGAITYGVVRLSANVEWFEQYGLLGAFVISFLASFTVLFPAPGFVPVWAIAGSPATNWAVVAVAAGIGGGLGEFTAYVAGYGGILVIRPDQSKWYGRAEDWMRRYGGLTIFIFSLTWLPFDIVGIAAGALRYPFWKFVALTVVARVIRSFGECYLAHLGYGILDDIQQAVGQVPAWGWAVIGIGLVVAIALAVLLWRRRRARP